jgi:acetyl-CoA carboxylase carboxyl transferase subunit beta
MFENVKQVITKHMSEIKQQFDKEDIIESRLERYRKIGRYNIISDRQYKSFKRPIRSWVSRMFHQVFHMERIEAFRCENHKTMGCDDVAKQLLYTKNMGVCKTCGYHTRLPSFLYLDIICDKDSKENPVMHEFNQTIESINTIGFPGIDEKLEREAKETGSVSALITGFSKINGVDVVLTLSNFGYRVGTLGSAEGEKFVSAVEKAIDENYPLVSVHQTGGARVTEGMFGLMQMVSTTAAVAKLKKNNVPYISIQADPTMAGVLASYASLGDIIVAEKNAQIGFAGLKVIEKTIQQQLEKDYQHAERVLERGGVDMVCSRYELKSFIGSFLSICGYE